MDMESSANNTGWNSVSCRSARGYMVAWAVDARGYETRSNLIPIHRETKDNGIPRRRCQVTVYDVGSSTLHDSVTAQ
jgi:hypothetical protein